MAGRFAGRVAVVTGGVSGIGFAICRRLAAEGAKLAIWDRDRAALDGVGARLGVAVHTECLDLVDAAAVMQAGVTTAQAMGRSTCRRSTCPRATSATVPMAARR